ncbi:menaquinone-dependent protoporphyrinogen IX dehydrogenase [Ferrimonas gelatinilytica]|uniref:Protoporphyrinogen IX dehydrogenase [quinone] n=1 Tax=Ferrimonas gelatinilytica TaxID=1255257 RepID=A0ABP9SBX8_9GAMM
MSGVLIVYMSRRGHTARVARTLMGHLNASGCDCDMMDVVEAKHEGIEWDRYHTVVVGAPVLYGKFDDSVWEFIKTHQAQLEARNNAFYCLSVVARNPAKATVEGNRYMQKFLAQSPWRPQLLKVVAGKVDYPNWGFWDSLSIKFIMKMTKGPTDPNTVIDYTDYNEVEAFAAQIRRLSQQGQ